MENVEDPMDTAIGTRLKSLRSESGLTLDALAAQSGVSRAMISRIERGEASPTAQLLARLCSALGTTLSRFFAFQQDTTASPLRRRDAQPVWRDPQTGYLRRQVSTEAGGSAIDLVEVIFPPGARVSFDRQPADAGVTQHIWLIEGRLEMTADGTVHAMEPGDCLFMRLCEPHAFHNPHTMPARYIVVLNRKPG
ncbi:transcriptional regulator, XRE family with cupin sensor [Rhizobium sp. RU20A]|uniref:helix-turn-helix domain-containing protein n=1 Tax=Rhizobium sp. RU20A TaxID=1907412 RepID=UPI000955D392|nr:XRE family transcriptional regulator [Rhizobium sp. RU20A]SIQ61525.1 transcriptional regulator, XRE family with cupin sensor [Rhizobium sp. RU20A]